jgi:hypothetical protein
MEWRSIPPQYGKTGQNTPFPANLHLVDFLDLRVVYLIAGKRAPCIVLEGFL